MKKRKTWDTPEPPWLTAAVDQRLALMKEAMGSDLEIPTDLVMTPLTEPAEDATDGERNLWERSCDNCGKYCPPGIAFYTGHVIRSEFKTQVIVMFGACARCAEREGKET